MCSKCKEYVLSYLQGLSFGLYGVPLLRCDRPEAFMKGYYLGGNQKELIQLGRTVSFTISTDLICEENRIVIVVPDGVEN